MPTEDPAKLWVQATGSTHPYDQKYDIYYLRNGVPTRVNLCGFSFFGELNGLPPNATEGIDLWSGSEGTATPDLTGPRYGMRFEYYFDQLKASRINFMRVWLFNDFPVRVYPFNKVNGLYQLQSVSDAYLARLAEFVSKARDRGIVVCLTLSARQSLLRGSSMAWQTNPFNSDNNTNQFIATDPKDPLYKDGGIHQFCDIEPPPQPDTNYNSMWTTKQKLYWVQRNLFTKVVAATKPYWNVMYEIMNEPAQVMERVVDWHVIVGTWLKSLLWDAGTGRRKRLVVINAPDNLIDGTDAAHELVDRMQSAQLADIFAFHGSQWGGRAGTAVNLCTALDIPNDKHIQDIVEGIYGSPGILSAMKRFAARPFALLFDSDALYWAQNHPLNYVQETLNVDGSFDYRWNLKHLHLVDYPTCTQHNTQLGLNQRLSMIASALNKDRITVF